MRLPNGHTFPGFQEGWHEEQAFSHLLAILAVPAILATTLSLATLESTAFKTYWKGTGEECLHPRKTHTHMSLQSDPL